METDTTFLRTVLQLEHLAGRSRLFGLIYRQLFYHRMMRIEVNHAALSPGAPVAHIGCGPFPVSALELARQGFRVTAVDNSEETIRANRERHGSTSIDFVCTEAGEMDYSGFEAVFVALHVAPRVPVIKRIIATADPGTRILLRNPRGSLIGRYTRLRAEDCSAVSRAQLRRLPGQKELLIVRTPRDTTVPQQCTLCELARSQGGRITHVPDHPQLAALGFRRGKDCAVLAVQPLGGPVVCSVAGRDVAVERSLAASVMVELADVLS